MGFRSITKLVCGSVLTAVLLTAAGEAFSQGKGRGRDGGNGHGNGGHGQNQQWKGWESKRERKADDWNSRRQQQVSDWNSRRQQDWSDQNSRRQQRSSDGNWRRREQQNVWNGWPGSTERRRDRDDDKRRKWRNRDDDDDDGDRRRMRYQQPVNYSPVQIFPGLGWGRYRDDKQYRREMKNAWKDERRAQKRYEREQRRYARDWRFGRGNYSNNDFYGNEDYYGFDNNQDWKQQILRTVIGNFLGGGFDGGNGLNLPIQIQRGYNEPYRTYTRPAYYDSPLYAGEDSYYPSDVGFGDGNSNLGGLLNELPIVELISQYTGDNDFVSSLLGGLFTQGYDEGFLAGQLARNNGADDNGFRDPYSYEGGISDPYSASIGRNRQLLSEGYSLGYQDALRGQTEYEPMSNGNTDLVSLLLNGVLGNV